MGLETGAGAQPAETFDVVVIGAGQAGLAVGRYLAEQGRRFLILEAGDGVATAWRARWDSLVLFTSRRYSSLPGLAFPGDPEGYPTRREVVEYLERYAETFDLPVEFASRVHSLSRTDGCFALSLADRVLHARSVVVATGPFQKPSVPAISAGLGPEIFQVHSADYRRAGDVPAGARVLVVGGGNSGFQIAKELSATCSVQLAIGSRQAPLPQRLLGRDLFWWLTRLGLMATSIETRLGRRLRERDALIGSSPRQLSRQGVELKARLVAANARTVRFADGSLAEPEAIVWATGYQPDHSWIELPIFDEEGHLVQRRGVTEVEGLYFVGLPWQHTRGSGLIGFVGEDAEFIASRIAGLDPTTDNHSVKEAA